MSSLDPTSVLGRAERFFRGWARVVVRHPKLVLLLSLLFTAGMGALAGTRLRVDNSTEGLLGSDSPSMGVLDALTRDFGPDKSFVIVVEGDVFSRPFLERLDRFHHALEGLEMELPTLGLDRRARRALARGEAVEPRPVAGGTTVGSSPERAPQAAVDDPFAGIEGFDAPAASSGPTIPRPTRGAHVVFEDVTSLVNVRDTSWQDGSLAIEELLETIPSDAELPGFRARVLSNPSFVGEVVDREGRNAVLLVRLRPMDEKDSAKVRDRLDEVVRSYESRDFHVRVGGIASLEVALNRIMERDISVVFSAALVVMLGLLYFLFRSAYGVVGPIVVVLLSVVATLGAMALFDAPMTGVTSVLSSFLLIIGLADAVHVQTAYRDFRKKGATNEEAIVEAIAEAAWPITFTAITDVAGLLSFRTSSLRSVQDMGTYASFGITVALVHSLCFLPAFLTFHRKSTLGEERSAAKKDVLDRFLGRCEAASRPVYRDGVVSRRGRNLVLFVTAGLTVLALLGSTRIRAYHDPLSWLPVSNPDRQNTEYLDRHLGGSGTVSIVVTAAPGHTVRERELLLRLERLERHVLAYRSPDDHRPIATHVSSVLDLVRESWMAVHDDEARYRVLPDTQQGVSDTFTLIEGAGPHELSKIVTADFAKTVMTVRVRWREAGAYVPFTRHVEDGVRRYVGDAARIELTGTVPANYEVVSSLNSDLLSSFGTALLSIAITMILVVWDVKLGLLSLVPNLLPILMMSGLMGAFGIPLDLMSLLVGSIAMGLVVDDTIHVLHYYTMKKDELGPERAVRFLFESTGRALVGTSVTLAAGFLLYVLATMSNVQRFGGLLGATILLALFGDLLITPALLRTIAPGEPLPEDEGG